MDLTRERSSDSRMTLADGRSFKDYPLTFALARRGRPEPCEKVCRGCGGPRSSSPGRVYCDACSTPEAKRARAVEQNSRWYHTTGRIRVRKPCRGCGGEKPPKAIFFCDSCQRARDDAARLKRERWEQRQRAADPVERARREAERLLRAMERERDGAASVADGPVMLGGRRPDAGKFPSLPSAPLLAKVNRLIRGTALDSPYMIELPASMAADTGAMDPSLIKREGAPSPREAVCSRLGVSEKRLYCWANGEVVASFDTADKVVTRAGWLWWEVWEPCRSDCSTVFGPVCEACHGHQSARRAFEGE
jgi:hypothetical protein